MLPARGLVLALATMLAMPAGAILARTVGEAQDGLGPPLVLPGDGRGILPAEGSLGTHGCPRPAKISDLLSGRYEEGAQVCVETSTVVQASTRRNEFTGSFLLRNDAGQDLLAFISTHWWQHGTPAVGMVVVVEGTITFGVDRWHIDPVSRWVDLTHPGNGTTAAAVSGGKIPEGSYVWLNATVGFTARNNDGDQAIGDDLVEVLALCPPAQLTTEITPPYFGIVSPPPVGAAIRLYGQVRFDENHGWWEVHPVRAWQALPTEQGFTTCAGGVTRLT
jgi:hypothetical protein